ncbi:glycoside hydrolase family 16 protein [Ferruginibacter sp. HRS2-29]|uniref:glycoside hydrolase family 16 protein n=1 Tax=Ferruginibacter sp. HRS2-29 TaxID=2487334 RepID=UPI0020CD6E1A|nr:glycoside hydrolase family 16 protein [Ferruginibacter sp. HRS2-29]MCP9749893.1 glycoside hydrolase family 16 protein [Ferruginibacter sp. HRS2-29]
MKFLNASVLALCLAATILSCSKSGGDNPTPPYVPPTTPPVTPPVTPPANTPVVPPIVYSGYTLLWNDEFNSTSIDGANWNFETGTGVNGDFGTGQLDRATNRPENATIENGVLNSGGGCLAITTRKETYLDRNYTSARLTTQDKGSWGPGTRIEARVWARDVRYKGQGFAFWMMPAEKPTNQPYIMWPQGGEVDIMEYVGAIPKYNLGTVHYAWSWENNTYQSWNHGHKGGYYSYQETQVPAVNPAYGGWPVAATETNAGSGGFHIYRVDWYANRMEFAVDDQVYHINYFNDGEAFNNAPDGQDADGNVTIGGKRVMKSEYSHHFAEWSPFSHKFFLLLTAGVGGNDNMTYGGAIVNDAQFPCTTYIDWVRVYQRN